MIAYMVPFFAVPITEYPVPAPERIFTLSPVQRTYCISSSCVDGADVTFEEELGLDELEVELEDMLELEFECEGGAEFSALSSSSGVGEEETEESVSSSGELSLSNESETEYSEPPWFAAPSFLPQAKKVMLVKRKHSAHSHVIVVLIFFIFTSFCYFFCRKILSKIPQQ